MSTSWDEAAPIYLQLKAQVVAMILDGLLKPGDALPSVRQVAAEHRINPLTVSRAYQNLADEHLVERRRGLGMFVTDDAPQRLLASERAHFLSREWPVIAARIIRLGLDWDSLRPDPLPSPPAQGTDA